MILSSGIIASSDDGSSPLNPPALHAYSFRKINPNYEGNCCRVISGGTQTDIPFDGNFVDLTALNNALGMGGQIHTWYDQIGSVNLTTPSVYLRPDVINNNGEVYLNFFGQDLLRFGTITNARAISIVAMRTAFQGIFVSLSASVYFGRHQASDISHYLGSVSFTSAYISNSILSPQTAREIQNNMPTNAYKNINFRSSSDGTLTNYRLGGASGSFGFGGRVREVLIFSEDQITAGNDNIDNYYNL